MGSGAEGPISTLEVSLATSFHSTTLTKCLEKYSSVSVATSWKVEQLLIVNTPQSLVVPLALVKHSELPNEQETSISLTEITSTVYKPP